MTETTQMVSEGIEFIHVHHFDVSGYLTMIEKYNDFHVDEDSIYLGEITYFETTGSNTRRSFTLSAERRDTLRVNTYEAFEETSIKVSIRDFTSKYFTEIIQKLDEKGRIISTHAVISDQLSDEIYLASITKFIYDDNGLQKLIVINERTGNEGAEVLCQNRRYDEAGNVTHLEYQDEDGVMTSIVDKAYEYHDTDAK